MKKYLAVLCATMLAVCCLALAACGGAASSGAASGSASSSAEAKVSYVGDWKLAGMQAEGVTITGDLSMALGTDVKMTVTLKDNGEGTITYGTDSVPIKWTEGDKGISVEMTETSTSAQNVVGNTQKFDMTYEDGVLSLTMEQSGQSGTLLFTQDGKLPSAVEISAAAATPITDESKLVGDWKLSGIGMMGMSAYGPSESISALAGTSDLSLSFAAGGKAKLSGSDVTYTVGSDGAAISEGGVSIPVMALGDNIIIDMSKATGLDMVMMYSK